VKNNGNYTLNEVVLSLGGISSGLFSVSPSKFSSMTINQTKTFTVVFSIPGNASVRSYNVTISVRTNSTATRSANFVLNVLPSNKTITETIIPSIDKYSLLISELEKNITYLQSRGVDVSEMLVQLNFTKEKIRNANLSIQSQDYVSASQLIENAKSLLDDLQSKIENVQVSPSSDLTIIIIAAVVAVAIIAVVVYLFLPTESKGFSPKMGWRQKNKIKKSVEKEKKEEKIKYKYK
jgi:hypothetical protein